MARASHIYKCLAIGQNRSMNKDVRINKYLAERGICSRRAADQWVSDGRVKVNGIRAELGTKISEGDQVEVDGRLVEEPAEKLIYYAYHKPVGIMSSLDPKRKDTLLTAVTVPERVFPVGRLDVASQGLMLLTNDGELSEAITHPSREHEKEYVVTVDAPISDEALEHMRRGVMVLGSPTKPAKIDRIGPSKFRIILTEGRNRQIRRMCETQGREVRKLVRVRIQTLELGELEQGTWRKLTQDELNKLKGSIR